MGNKEKSEKFPTSSKFLPCHFYFDCRAPFPSPRRCFIRALARAQLRAARKCAAVSFFINNRAGSGATGSSTLFFRRNLTSPRYAIPRRLLAELFRFDRSVFFTVFRSAFQRREKCLERPRTRAANSIEGNFLEKISSGPVSGC